MKWLELWAKMNTIGGFIAIGILCLSLLVMGIYALVIFIRK